MRTKIVSLFIIMCGMFLLAFPKVSQIYADWQQQRLVEQWQESFAMMSYEETSISEEEFSYKLNELQANQIGGMNVPEISVSTNEVAEEKNSSESGTIELPANVEGMLYIDKIDLELPILHGATEQNMNISVSSIENTGGAGEVGNYAIAGHRSRTYGRHFNRLNELEEGDFIEVHNGEQLFQYTVTETFLVEPDEVWVLESNGVDKEITLVTCDPAINATHRLIVKGKIM